MELAHEGSSAQSLATDIGLVQISPSGDKGCFVGVPLRRMDSVTVTSMVGSAGSYKLLVANGNTEASTHEEWVQGGSKLLIKLHIGEDAAKTVGAMMNAGLDHHLLIREGDHSELLTMLCAYMGIQKISV